MAYGSERPFATGRPEDRLTFTPRSGPNMMAHNSGVRSCLLIFLASESIHLHEKCRGIALRLRLAYPPARLGNLRPDPR